MEQKSKKDRKELMKTMKETDSIFIEFGQLDDKVFADGIIPKKYKELCMITVSINAGCAECIDFHIQEAIAAGAIKDELIEAVKMGHMAGGSLTYPIVRYAFNILIEKGIIKV